ncbi:MAG: hypothetical protein AUJ71_04225 [Candidatus Omnitrophica bacterium CG1_02_49_16]|nr:MAG: hypothetical protein AUJ71_04225 [Candidatus Omnitrophica bacterium CG1_02_49_16]
MAALSGLEICNIEIYTEDSEIPGLDGSALPIVKLLKRLGIQRQKAARDVYQIKEPIFCYDKAKTIAVYPDDVFRVAYVLDYSHPDLKYQTASFEVTPKTFETEIAPARTFCLEEEASALKKKGFGSGADTQNTLVFGKTGVIQNTLRFTNECARHKVLDIIGDTNLLGYRILGSIVGIRSGHGLNAKLVEAIRKQRGQ